MGAIAQSDAAASRWAVSRPSGLVYWSARRRDGPPAPAECETGPARDLR
jgi:hypothetical protein